MRLDLFIAILGEVFERPVFKFHRDLNGGENIVNLPGELFKGNSFFLTGRVLSFCAVIINVFVDVAVLLSLSTPLGGNESTAAATTDHVGEVKIVLFHHPTPTTEEHLHPVKLVLRYHRLMLALEP
ncbi:MAG TPA: hypothetical protein VMA75_02305 [Candidatus Paceibacterota bacterium]|nr:hypothetical protein [Candidatus Paceibacterota bacterium]